MSSLRSRPVLRYVAILLDKLLPPWVYISRIRLPISPRRPALFPDRTCRSNACKMGEFEGCYFQGRQGKRYPRAHIALTKEHLDYFRENGYTVLPAMADHVHNNNNKQAASQGALPKRS